MILHFVAIVMYKDKLRVSMQYLYHGFPSYMVKQSNMKCEIV